MSIVLMLNVGHNVNVNIMEVILVMNWASPLFASHYHFYQKSYNLLRPKQQTILKSYHVPSEE